LDFNYSVSLGPKSDALDLSFTMLIPQADFDAHIKRGPKIDIVSETLDFDETAETLTRHIDKSITSLRAVLESCEMTVADCTRLSIGQIIPLPGVSLQALNIEAELKDNRICIARGAMGIHKTRRAVQLVEDISPSFIDEGLASVLD
jgi:flagellar motor switch protein FliM